MHPESGAQGAATIVKGEPQMTASARHRTRSASGLTFALVASLAGIAGLAPTAQAAQAAPTAAAATAAVPNPVDGPYVAPGYQKVSVGWQPPRANGVTVTGYRVTVSPGGKVYTVSAAATHYTVYGLTNNVRYGFRVEALSAGGPSAPRANASYPRGYDRFTTVPRGNNADTNPDVVATNAQHAAWRYLGTGTGRITSGAQILSLPERYRAVTSPRWSATDSRHCDLIAFTFHSTARCFKLGSDNKWRGSMFAGGTSLGAYRHIITPGDVTGDGIIDMYGITDAGDLRLHRGYTTNYAPNALAFGAATRISGGWQAFNEVSAVGDFNKDGRNDLVARKPDGTLWLYAGSGTGGFRFAKQIATGWAGAAAITGGNDFDKDGRNDIVAIWADGSLRNHRGNGSDGLLGSTLMTSSSFTGYVGPN